MSVIGEQIKKYRGIRGMTQQEIADALGESSGRVIYNWEKGIGRPDCDKLAKLCDLLDVSADEMIGCRSMSERPTAAEWETIKKYRVLDEHGKEIVDYLIDSEYRRVSATGRKAKCRMLRMDYYTLPASAGTGNILDSELAGLLALFEQLVQALLSGLGVLLGHGVLFLDGLLFAAAGLCGDLNVIRFLKQRVGHLAQFLFGVNMFF